jgi:hypothetical protein
MIHPPWYQDSVEHLAFNAYASHQEQIEAFINLLAAADDPNDGETQWDALRQVGLNVNDLSPFDLDYIEKEVARRWQ